MVGLRFLALLQSKVQRDILLRDTVLATAMLSSKTVRCNHIIAWFNVQVGSPPNVAERWALSVGLGLGPSSFVESAIGLVIQMR